MFKIQAAASHREGSKAMLSVFAHFAPRFSFYNFQGKTIRERERFKNNREKLYNISDETGYWLKLPALFSANFKI